MNQEENFLFLKIIYALTFNKNLILHFFFLLVAFFFIPFCPTCFSLHGTRRVTFLEFIGHPQWSPQEPPDFSVGRLLKLLDTLCHNHVSPESIALRRIEWAQRRGWQCSIRSRTKTFLTFCSLFRVFLVTTSAVKFLPAQPVWQEFRGPDRNPT